MQSLTWYAQRLRTMSPSEMAWRIRSSLRDTVDRCLLGLRQRPKPLSEIINRIGAPDLPAFRVSELNVGEWASTKPGQLEHDWYRRLLSDADRILAGRVDLFDLENCDLGSPVDWNRDPKHGTSAPMTFSPWIDYRDVRVAGDCKFVWEPNRHHQLVILARAYRASGQISYAAAAIEQLTSWLDQCPYGLGMNWRSPLELGIRLINWVWTIDLIRETGLVDGEFRSRLLNAVQRHLWEISRKYSQASSANNHLIGEAAGVFIASSYFETLKGSSGRQMESHDILSREILHQTWPDGGGREQALGYHLFVLQFFLLAGWVARRVGRDFSADYWARMEKMIEFAMALSEGADNLPMFGDSDDGYVLDLDSAHGHSRWPAKVGAVIFGRNDFKGDDDRPTEAVSWLFGGEGQHRYSSLSKANTTTLTSRAFPDTGYYLLQCGDQGDANRISLIFDCGPLGLEPLAAHGHADALSVMLRAFGQDILLDPGTYDYFSFANWRNYFRSTRAHNTIVIDGENQSIMSGPFMWAGQACARCVNWEPAKEGGRVAGEHDGYTRLKDPVIHRRSVELDGRERTVTIRDDVLARGNHNAEVCFHLSEHCRIADVLGNQFRVDAGRGEATIELDPRLTVRMLTGSENPIGGWVSRGYHRKTASTTLVGSCQTHGHMSLICRIRIGRAERHEE